MKTLCLFLLLSSIYIFNNVHAQNKTNLRDQSEAYQKAFPTEKLYFSFDKPYYSAGDTLWFKSFLLNGDLTSAQRSDKIYVELYSDSLKRIDQKVIALNNGLGYGDFDLPNKLSEGTYIIRAYSNWQQNFGSDYFFQKSFYIGNAGEKTWLIDAYQKLSTANAKTILDLKIKLSDLEGKAAGLKDVDVFLMNGTKRLMKATLQTSVTGTIETQIPLTEKLSGDYSFLIVDQKDKTRKSVLPIILQNADQVDLQFMPEGGSMVNNIYGKVAFKAIGADGLAKAVNGNIVNSKNEVVATFATAHNGMGSFYLLPQLGESYFATFDLAGKAQKIQLPIAKAEGTTLRIDALSKPDSVYIYLKASEGKRLENYQLLAQAGNTNIITATINLKNGISVIKLAKQIFPDGIIHFTLISPEQQPLNERQVFIHRNHKINLAIKADKNTYGAKDSVSLDITATKEDGTPLRGTFAIAVTDDGQVRQADSENIASYFLLQSDLKGKIEDAGWYFDDEEPSTLLALDHLLLTQGWIGYKWDEILLSNSVPKFKAENGNMVRGRLNGLFNKPLEGVTVNMLSLGKSIMVIDTLTDKNGNFEFKNLPLIDSTAYTIKIKNAKGKTATGNITVEEFERSKLPLTFDKINPWYVNTDSTVLKYFKTIQQQVKLKEKAEMLRTGTLLNEVVIKGQLRKKEIISKDAWDANFFLSVSEEELKKTPQKTLRNLLEEKIPGFNVGNFWGDKCGTRPSQHSFVNFRIGSSLISHVLIDKINTNFAASGQADLYQESGKSISAEPETGKLVYETNTYIFNALSASEITNITFYKGCNYYYLDITTRGGKRPWIGPTPGRFIYRPLPIYISKDFYIPKYNATNKDLPDYRSTIFWDANVVTDENGKAKVSFFTADKASTYSVKIEGTDLNGRFGFQKSRIGVVRGVSAK